MVPFFPKQIATKAILVYLLSIAIVSIVFMSYSMGVGYIAMGCIWVIGFFIFAHICTFSWKKISTAQFIGILFSLAFILRLIWVVYSYYYYLNVNGDPFEFDAKDAVGYHADAEWLADSAWSVTKAYLFGNMVMLSDSGYPLFLSIVYRIFGPNIIIARIIKALLSSFTCVLVYELATRTFDDRTGKMAGIMMALMPNLIMYCGYHLKETEMLFLEVAFLERLDFVIRNRKINVLNVLLPTLLAGSLFLFRTVLGAAAIFSFATAVLLSSAPNMKKNGRRAALIGWGIAALVVLSGGTATTELESLWEDRDSNLADKRVEQTLRGNRWAQYATGSVMAPLAFVMPFSTMVDVDQQYNQQEKSGGNYVRNFMGLFALLAIYESIRRKKIRDFAMIGSFVIAYLGVVSLSGFSNSERFLLPGLPCLIMMWAYGISTLRANTYRLLTPWCFVVFAMEIGWAYFKLGSRGLF